MYIKENGENTASMHSETFLSRTHGEISKKMCYLRSCWYRDLTGFLTIKIFAKILELQHFVRPLGKEKTPETSYREMNTNLHFAIELSLLQIDSYGHHVYDRTHRRISYM